MALKPFGRLYESETNNTILDLSCSTFGQLFDNENVLQQANGHVSKYLLGTCADIATNVTEDSIRQEYNQKVVLFVDDPGSCKPMFFQQWQPYLEAMYANASAVVYLDKSLLVPGTWYTTYFRPASNNIQPQIPFLHCVSSSGNPVAVAAVVDRLRSATSMKQYYPSGIEISVVASQNLWKEMCGTIKYHVMFRGFLSLLFIFALISCIRLAQRFVEAAQHKGASCSPPKQWTAVVDQTCLLAISIEAAGAASLALYYAIDAQWCAYENPFIEYRHLFIGCLLSFSSASSILVGSRFSYLKRCFVKQKTSESSQEFFQRYRKFFMHSAMGLILFDLLSGILRNFATLKLIGNLVGLISAISVTSRFLWEGHQLSILLHKAVAPHLESSKRSTFHRLASIKAIQESLPKPVKVTYSLLLNLRFWVRIHNVFFVVVLSLGIYGSFNEHQFFVPRNFAVIMAIVAVCRCGLIFAKLGLLYSDVELLYGSSTRQSSSESSNPKTSNNGLSGKVHQGFIIPSETGKEEFDELSGLSGMYK